MKRLFTFAKALFFGSTQQCLGGSACAFVALFATSSIAEAQQMPALPKGVRLVLSSCEKVVAKKALLDQLRIELLSTGVMELDVVDVESAAERSENEAEGDRIATVQVYFPECDDDAGLVNLRVSDRLTAKYVERSLMVSDISGPVRPRAIALAIAELLRASWLELVLTQDRYDNGAPQQEVRSRLVTHLKERTIETAEPRKTTEEQALAIDAERKALEDQAQEERWYKSRLDWVAGSRMFPQGGSGDLSTTVSGSMALNRVMRLQIGGLAAGGGLNDPGRDVHSFEIGGRIALGIAGGNAPEIEVAPCVEVGFARLSGTKLDDQRGAIAIGSVHSTLRATVAKGVDVLLNVQAGYVIAPIDIEDEDGKETIGGIKGPMLGVAAGLSGIL